VNRKGSLKQRAGSTGRKREPYPPFRTAAAANLPYALAVSKYKPGFSPRVG